MLKYQKTGDSVMVIWLRFSYKKIEKTAEPDWDPIFGVAKVFNMIRI